MIVSFSFISCQFPLLMSLCHFFQLWFLLKLDIFNNILLWFMQSFALLFAVIPECIALFLNRKTSQSEHKKAISRKKARFTYVQSSAVSKLRFNIHFVLSIGVLTALDHGLMYFFIDFCINSFFSPVSLLGMFSTLIGCYFVLKQKLFRHHIFVLVVMTIDTALMFWYLFRFLNIILLQMFDNYGTFICVSLVYSLSFSAREIIEHYLMRVKFVSHSLILMTEGTVSLVVYMLYMLILKWIDCGKDYAYFLIRLCVPSQWNFFARAFMLFFDYSSMKTLYAWGYVVFSFLMNYFRIQTNQKLSPLHRYIAEVLLLLFWLIHDLIFRAFLTSRIVRLVNSLFMLVTVCVFNEYLIIRLCGLEVNTKSEIEKRAKEEELSIEKLQKLIE